MGLRLDGGDVEGVERGGGRADGGEEDGGRRCRGQQALRPTVHRFRPRFFSLFPNFSLLFLYPRGWFIWGCATCASSGNRPICNRRSAKGNLLIHSSSRLLYTVTD
jgi:hypothetical protein